MKKIISTLLLLLFLLVSSLAKLEQIYPSNENTGFASSVISSLSSPIKLQSAEIRITSDDDWIDLGYPGSGSAIDPYRIENLTINTDEHTGILVHDTSKHFIIRNCSIKSEHTGILTYFVGDGCMSIVENTIHDNSIGIDISESKYSIIRNNLFKFNNRGMWIFYCDLSTIENNIFQYNENSLLIISSSPGVRIEGNTFYPSLNYDPSISSIYVSDSQGLLINNNNFYFNSIYFENSKAAVISNNEFIESGLMLPDSPLEHLSSFLVENNKVNNKELGFFYGLSNVSISDNNYGQLILVDCDSVRIENQILSSTSCGLSIFYCSNIQISRINCTINNKMGISIAFSNNITVSYCNLSCNYLQGINLRYSSYCSIFRNDFYRNNRYGVFILESQQNQIFHNYFIENNLDDISQGSDTNRRNKWYNSDLKEGNYWSDLGEKCTYLLAGDSGNRDLYPLNRPSTCINPRTKTTVILTVPISSLIVFYAIYYFISYKRRKKIISN